MENKPLKKLDENLFTYNETPILNFIIHVGFAVGIATALTLLVLSFMRF